MPGTIWSTLLMLGVQILWFAVVYMAALGSFAALETVTGPDGTSYPAIKCLSGYSLTFTVLEEYTSDGQACVCNGDHISNVSALCNILNILLLETIVQLYAAILFTQTCKHALLGRPISLTLIIYAVVNFGMYQLYAECRGCPGGIWINYSR